MANRRREGQAFRGMDRMKEEEDEEAKQKDKEEFLQGEQEDW